MKKMLIAVALASVIGFSGCIGSFSLTQKLYSWNQEATGSKFVNTGIMWLLGFITPVYGVTMFIDVAILNLIEFWTGGNPMAFTGSEQLEKTVTSNDNTYRVTMGNNRITVEQISGTRAVKTETLRYDAGLFYYDDGNNGPVKVGALNNSTLSLYSPDGKVTELQLDETSGQVAAIQ